MSKSINLGNTLSGGTIAKNSSYYFPIGDNASDQSGGVGTEASGQNNFRLAGTLSKLYVKIATNGITGTSTYRSRVATANGAMSVSITTGATGEFEDTVNTDTITANTLVGTQMVLPNNGTTMLIAQRSVVFSATSNTMKQYCSASALQLFTVNAGTTRYWGLGEDPANYSATSESSIGYKFETAGTLKNLWIHIGSISGGGSTTHKIRKNGADSGITVSISSTGTFEDTTNTYTVVAGDLINWDCVCTGANTNFNSSQWAIEFVSTNSNFHSINHASQQFYLDTTDWYTPIGGNAGRDTPDGTNLRQKLRGTWLVSYLGISIFSNAGGVNTFTFALNGSDTALTLSVTAATTGIFEDTSHSVTTADGDEANYHSHYVSGSEIIGSWAGVMMSESVSVVYTLTATKGSITLTGETTGLSHAYNLVAAKGSIVLTGFATVFEKAWKMTCVFGSIVLTGEVVAFKRGWKFVCSQGSYVLTGISANLVKGHSVVATTGSYILTGISATVTSARSMIATMGSYTLTGETVSFKKALNLIVDMGSYVYTGISTGISHARTIVATKGAYVLTGEAVVFFIGHLMTAVRGLYTFIGHSVRFLFDGESTQWSKQTKHTATFSDQSKNHSIWTDQSKS